MIRKTVTKSTLKRSSSPAEDLAYWLGKSPEERLAAVELLRRQIYESSARLQRIARVIQRTKG